MSDHRDDELNRGAPGQEEEFSLEEILAEFGGGPPKPTRWKEDTIPFPVRPRRPEVGRPAVSPGGGRVVAFPGGKREAPRNPPPVPPKAPPEPEPEPVSAVELEL